MPNAEKAVRQSVSLPSGVARRVRSLARTNRTSANRVLVDLIEAGLEARAISFTKGCYPGQEIVARTHYLGKQRRRMFVGHLDGAQPVPGCDVLDAQGAPVGRVVLAAASPDGGTDLLFEAQIAALAEGALSVAGARIVPGELPYALPQ